MAVSPAAVTASSSVSRDCWGMLTASEMRSASRRVAQVASRIKIGKMDVKSCAAIVIDRSNSSTRVNALALRASIRTGHRWVRVDVVPAGG